MAASYDRELIAQMLEGARRGDLHQFSVESIERAISQLRAADNADAAGVHTARRLPPDGIHTCSYQCDQPECIRAQRDDLAAQAERDAAEIVRLRGVEGLMQLARNWCLAWGEWAHDADPGCAKENAAEAALRAALTTALAQQPAAVDGAMVVRYKAAMRNSIGKRPDDAIRDALTAALAQPGGSDNDQ